MNKNALNSIIMDGSTNRDCFGMIADSYDLIKPKLRRRSGKREGEV